MKGKGEKGLHLDDVGIGRIRKKERLSEENMQNFKTQVKRNRQKPDVQRVGRGKGTEKCEGNKSGRK